MQDSEEHLGLQAGLQEEAMSRQRAAATAGEDRKTSARCASGVPRQSYILGSQREGLLLALVATESETTTPTCFLWL